jgi:hypothetical protein
VPTFSIGVSFLKYIRFPEEIFVNVEKFINIPNLSYLFKKINRDMATQKTLCHF